MIVPTQPAPISQLSGEHIIRHVTAGSLPWRRPAFQQEGCLNRSEWALRGRGFQSVYGNASLLFVPPFGATRQNAWKRRRRGNRGHVYGLPWFAPFGSCPPRAVSRSSVGCRKPGAWWASRDPTAHAAQCPLRILRSPMRHRPIRAVSGVALHNIEVFTVNESLPFANRLRPAAACADVFWCRDERQCG
jgi:hypothetical protein